MKRKMRGAGFTVLMLWMICGLVVLSCKKKRAWNEEDAQDTVDARYAQAEFDEVIKDINTVVMEQFLLRGKDAGITGAPGSPTTSICGAALDTSLITSGIVTIQYNGNNCFGRIRSGAVKFSIQDYPVKKWKHAGAIINIEYQAYKLQRQSDGKSITISGNQTLTNESGGTWYELWYVNEPRVIYKLAGDNLKVTFDKDDVAKFSLNRRMTYTFSNFVTTCQVQGTGSADGNSNLENWGMNRKGEKFYSEVVNPYIWRTSCGSVAPISGEVKMKVEGKEHHMRCLYAVDKDGNDVSGSSTPCPYGWKVELNYKKKTRDLLFSYY